MEHTINNALISVVFALLGFVLLFAGYRVFDWLTPTDLNADVFRDGNVASAILAGAFIISLAIVVAAAIS